MIERIVSSLAILKVNSDQGQNYLDCYVPFVAVCIQSGKHQHISEPVLQQAVAEEFGLHIPRNVLKTILSRVHRTGYLTFRNGVYQRNAETLPFPDFLQTRNKTQRQYEALIQRLQKYCTDNYATEWSRDEADAALFSFLDKHSVGILRSTVAGVPVVAGNTPPEHTDFLVSAFVTYIERQDPEGFEFLETVVKGRMLADVLVLPGSQTQPPSFRNTSVYLDTTFVLRVIGVAPQDLQTPCQELISLLREQGAQLKIFEHTYAEIEGVLNATMGRLRSIKQTNGSSGETIDYLIQQRATRSDVELIVAKLPNTLLEYGIAVERTPVVERDTSVDEENFRELLQEQVRYRYDSTLQRDIQSLTAIFRLRGGRMCNRIEDCRAIFVTTNSRLASASANFFRQEYEQGRVAIPHCLNDQVIATLAWLRAPGRAPNLPRHRIIANCYAALKPSEMLWQKYLAEIERLLAQGKISEDDYYLLRYANEARQALMDATKGEPAVFTEGTVGEVLAKAQAEARRETEQSLEIERTQRKTAESTVTATTQRVLQAQEAYHQRIGALSRQGGKLVGNACRVLFILALIAISLLVAPWPGTDQTTLFIKWIVFVAAILGAAISIWSMYRGTTIATLADNIEHWASKKLQRTIDRGTHWLRIEYPEDVDTLTQENQDLSQKEK